MRRCLERRADTWISLTGATGQSVSGERGEQQLVLGNVNFEDCGDTGLGQLYKIIYSFIEIVSHTKTV